MAWFTRISRFGDIHFIYGQEHANSCGPACVLMCVFKINKITPGKTAVRPESEILADYGVYQKKLYDGEAYGTFPQGLVKILNTMGCGAWTSRLLDPIAATQKIVDTVGVTDALSGPTITVNPVIVGVNWDGSKASHWIVIDTVRKLNDDLYATVCDPNDANVHIQSIREGSPFIYNAKPELAVDVWGTRNATAYNRHATGRVRDWPVIFRI